MKLKKLLRQPGLFWRDYFLKRHPLVLNEIRCPLTEEQAAIRHNDALHALIENHLDIDVVFTWVNDSDPAWQQRFNQANNSTAGVHCGRSAKDNARFANHDELRYSLLSVQKHMPWVRRIYLVTDAQRPHWLGDGDGVHVVDHRDIIDAMYLPTFNSHVIEACLHRIPGLSEHFIYFNDDVFVARPQSKNHFFKSNGIASLFLAQKSLKEMSARGCATPTMQAAANSVALLREHYGKTVDTPLVHTYMPLRKSMYELLWNRHPEAIRSFLNNRFRGTQDLNLATFLAPWAAYLEGWAAPSLDVCRYFNVRSPAAAVHWKYLLGIDSQARPHSFCANDFNDGYGRNAKETLGAKLNQYFDESQP